MYISYNFCYRSFPLWPIFSPSVDVQLKRLNPFCSAYPWLIFFRVNWYVEKTMAISKLYIKNCKLAPTVTVLCTGNIACTTMHAELFYMHKNQCTQILNLLSPVCLASTGQMKNPYLQYCIAIASFLIKFRFVFV